MYAEERQAQVERALTDHGRVAVVALAEQFAVTPETIRRDLDALEARGVLRRVHGGAVPASRISRSEESVAERRDRNAQAKARIARAAMRFIPSGFSGAVALDAGTTTGLLADQLARWVPDAPHQSLVVITNSLPIAGAVSENPDLEVQLLGGRVRGITSAAVGPTTIAQLARLRPDIAFLGANGLEAEFGLSTADDEESAVKSALTRGAHRAIALVDSSKLGEQKLSSFAGLADLDALVTDREPEPRLARALDVAGVEVIVA